jgi:Holliday junction resolvasome RuvABC endonuclease subunit
VRILGLDLSLGGTGIVRLDPQGRLSEHWLVKTDPSWSQIQRYAYVAGSVMGVVVDGLVGLPTVDLVAIEDVFASRNMVTFRLLAQLSAVVQYVLYRREVPVELMTAPEWRKLLFGPSSKITQKDQTRVAVSQRYRAQLGGLDIVHLDENVMDAFCVAEAAYRRHVEGVVIPQPRRRKSEVA